MPEGQRCLFCSCSLNTNSKVENIPVFPNLEKCKMVILPKGGRGGKKKEKEYCVPNKIEARMQECRNVNVLQAVIRILDAK